MRGLPAVGGPLLLFGLGGLDCVSGRRWDTGVGIRERFSAVGRVVLVLGFGHVFVGCLFGCCFFVGLSGVWRECMMRCFVVFVAPLQRYRGIFSILFFFPLAMYDLCHFAYCSTGFLVS